MRVHESNVNFRNLIRDLAEMYPSDVSEVVVTELVANALDAGAKRVDIAFDDRTGVLVVSDDGTGMTEAQFEEYHDFAAGLKARGAGIGFAGLGAKVSFNVAERVITETRGHTFARGSNWYLQSQKKLVWEETEITHLQGRGTRVEVHFGQGNDVAYSTSADLVALLRRQYLPLTDPAFLELYERLGYYSQGLRFSVNGEVLKPLDSVSAFALEKTRVFLPQRAGKKYGYGLFGLSGREYPFGPELSGVLLCTHGKVIKGEFFNQFPGELGPRIVGVVEVPDLVRFLTTAKTDLIRKGRHRELEGLLDPVRQEFKAWLKALGVGNQELAPSDEAIKLERELKKLIESVPELAEFPGFRSRKTILGSADAGSLPARAQAGATETYPTGTGAGGQGRGPQDQGDGPGDATVADPNGTRKAEPISRKAPRGPRITFSDVPDRPELGWVEGSVITINAGHPAYKKAHPDAAARRLHCLFTIGSAVQRFLATEDAPRAGLFIDRLMAAWGRQ